MSPTKSQQFWSDITQLWNIYLRKYYQTHPVCNWLDEIQHWSIDTISDIMLSSSQMQTTGVGDINLVRVHAVKTPQDRNNDQLLLYLRSADFYQSCLSHTYAISESVSAINFQPC